MLSGSHSELLNIKQLNSAKFRKMNSEILRINCIFLTKLMRIDLKRKLSISSAIQRIFWTFNAIIHCKENSFLRSFTDRIFRSLFDGRVIYSFQEKDCASVSIHYQLPVFLKAYLRHANGIHVLLPASPTASQTKTRNHT
ncbi:hypothetical protein LEP3755_46650 [Leptolyngbya sp. NIES-3755]|nr:hypothetical protein LEP3755_46650 [Leptolyngbya sp. NIES-3755]